ncbi:hypothetical protein [Plantactinospora sp. KLBMP9567]|uniref:hypothetical protein n=1 Tax=Plantactinospora sp. KLBMP9567 TaxID=3085900 RepID=UPI0029815D63|nr:hypothetical protein [Plantactinospora sp. KLBMP9567]MDW5323949.1 hypothetical protein [Plantactinospora sp. KLBMP9567]
MTQPVRVNVPGLRTVGGEIVGHGTELKRNVTAVEGQLVPPGGPGVNGWATLDAATRASDGWEAYLNGLGGRIEAAGQSLIDSADNYQGSDQRAGQRHGGVRVQ